MFLCLIVMQYVTGLSVSKYKGLQYMCVFCTKMNITEKLILYEIVLRLWRSKLLFYYVSLFSTLFCKVYVCI